MKRQLPARLHSSTIFLRKLGKVEEALTAARALYDLRPDWRSIGTLTSTLRAPGGLEGALDTLGVEPSWRHWIVAPLSGWTREILGTTGGLGVGFWIWISGVPPLRRGSDP